MQDSSSNHPDTAASHLISEEIWDQAQLLQRVRKPERVAKLVESFLKHCPNDLEKLGRAEKHCDRDAIKFVAHTIKGVSSNLGAPRAASIAKQLEQAVQDQVDDVELTRLISQVYEELHTVTEHLNKYLNHQQPT